MSERHIKLKAIREKTLLLKKLLPRGPKPSVITFLRKHTSPVCITSARVCAVTRRRTKQAGPHDWQKEELPPASV